MTEKFKKIMGGLLLIILSLVGMWEFMQLYMRFDLPEAIVVLPLAGFVAGVLLKKFALAAPVLAAVLSVVYQLVENQGSKVEIASLSKANVLINLLPVVLILMFLGVGGGLLARVLINRKKPLAMGIVCCILGLAITFGPGIFLFQNPLYPFLAKHEISSYAEKYNKSEYPVSEVISYYSVEELEYEGKVVMSDGKIYALYHRRETGEVYEIEQ